MEVQKAGKCGFGTDSACWTACDIHMNPNLSAEDGNIPGNVRKTASGGGHHHSTLCMCCKRETKVITTHSNVNKTNILYISSRDEGKPSRKKLKCGKLALTTKEK